MRHIFLINPMAGGGGDTTALIEQIQKVCEARAVDYKIYLTTAIGDATEATRRFCQEASPDIPLRIYACGGDGTLGEVANGMADCPYAELGIIPCGTGNDFVRNFAPKANFHDIAAQLDGKLIELDLLRVNDGYCVNMVNIGFDCEVVCKKDEYNQKPRFPHKLAYVAGVASTFFQMPGVNARVRVDGGEEKSLSLQLTTMANGICCGGGFHSNPRARLQDGMIDILQIDRVSRFTFLRLIGSYKAGTHLDGDKNANILKAFKARSIELTFDRDQNVCLDGEVIQMRKLTMELLPRALRFSLPKGTHICHPSYQAPKEATV